MILSVWLFLILIVGAVTVMAKRVGLLPIVSQLIFIFLLIPLLYFYILPSLSITGKDIISPMYIKIFYTINFSILFGYILSDVVDLKYEKKSIMIALPSFFIPFIAGIFLAIYILKETILLPIVSIGLLSAITAIPVLFLYLKNFNYDEQRTKNLIHAAIFMDILCWSIFAVIKNDTHILLTILAITIGLIPFVINKILKIKNHLAYSIPFFIGMVILDYFKLNILMFGIIYMLSLALCKVKFILPFPKREFYFYQTFIAIPFIIIYGVIQINYKSLTNESIWILLSLLLIPIVSKILGSWIGLSWAEKSLDKSTKWFETIMLNTRGLTEIVFLNMLFQQLIINQQTYFSMMLMGLISTVIAGVYGNRKY